MVTGASSGFGKETASLLAEHGLKVYGTSRSPTAQTDSGIRMLQLNVDNDESVENCVKELLDETGRLDIVINNAGFVLTGGAEETPLADAKAQFETAFWGCVRMIKASLPTMRKQQSGQIINISSMAAILPVPFEGYYAAAKAALLAWSEALRHEVKNLGIKVSVVEPGFFRTNLGSTRKSAGTIIEDYDKLRERAVKTLDEDFRKGADPMIVAETILRIIKSRSPKLEYPVGKEKRYRTLKHILPQSVMESGVRRHWKLDKTESTVVSN